MNKRIVSVMSVLLLSVSACGGPSGDDPTLAPSEVASALSADESVRVLDLVNYPAIDTATFDDAIGLDRRAASNIIAQRNGLDGVAPSADDDLFETVAELDDIAYVGDLAFTKLRDYAVAHPAPAGERVEGIAFSGWQVEALVAGVNSATLEEIDITARLDARAAANLVRGRPYTSVTQMGAVAAVGPVALTALRAYAPVFWGRRSGPAVGGVFDGVTFEAATVSTALEIANQASHTLLVQNGLPSNGAASLVGNRPYTGLAAVAAVSGVGTATMTALRAYALSGAWTAGPTPTVCEATLSARYDGDAVGLTELLRVATTGDWPVAEVLAYQAAPCVDLADASARAALMAQLVASDRIQWGYTPRINPTITHELSVGTGSYASALYAGVDAIQERVESGRWVPADDLERDMLAALDRMVAALVDGPNANPNDYHWGSLRIEAEECSQTATVLIDTSDLRVWVVHRFPGC